MARIGHNNIILKFDLASLEKEAKAHKQHYWKYVWLKTLQDLDLSKIEGVELLSGDSEGTIIHLTELVYCVGFTYNNKEQFDYLKKHVSEVSKRIKSTICIEVDSKEPLPPEAIVKDGKLLDEDCDKTEDIEMYCRELQKIYEEATKWRKTHHNVYIL